MPTIYIKSEMEIKDQPYITTWNISEEDFKLLESIKNGHKVLVAYNDKRIRYKITDEECEFIVQMRKK